ncbi:Mov34/MPN/PAD-1 family protein [Hyphomonas sp.]|uniref:Mov34/MPN/PAD-1 family protein n=1 Tax=Hyphomonas sp. TaxID=87 RepID=UPI0025B9C974|nr:Mov34/MPN/PAD-1 family protein [Hyphomonas sp.]
MTQFVITDRVLEDIRVNIAAHQPERGGALFSFPWTNWVVDFLYDADAVTTSSTYTPSAWLISEVQKIEREKGVHFVGVVHSHPGGADRPSGPDHEAFRSNLHHNPHLPAFLAPIVTKDRAADDGAKNETTLGASSRMTSYVAYRSQPGGPSEEAGSMLKADLGWFPRPRSGQPVRLEPAQIDIMSVGEDIAALTDQLETCPGGSVRHRTGPPVALGATSFLSEAIEFGDSSLTLLISSGYPMVAPIALVSTASGQPTHQVHFNWPFLHEGDRSQIWSGLLDSIKAAIQQTETGKQDV